MALEDVISARQAGGAQERYSGGEGAFFGGKSSCQSQQWEIQEVLWTSGKLRALKIFGSECVAAYTARLNSSVRWILHDLRRHGENPVLRVLQRTQCRA